MIAAHRLVYDPGADVIDVHVSKSLLLYSKQAGIHSVVVEVR